MCILSMLPIQDTFHDSRTSEIPSQDMRRLTVTWNLMGVFPGCSGFLHQLTLPDLALTH